MSDSLAYGDDLRKYHIEYSGLEFKTFPTTRKLTWEITFNLLWFSRPLKSRGCRMRLKS